ncbi:MAG: hypothetical protein JXN60_03250, partial [Lentisphaerae bacterium]|nr:hypothetical protein [Lentisphaerota bacterium]
MAKKRSGSKISDILVRNGVITADAIAAAEEQTHANGSRLEKYLTENNLVKPEDMILALSEYLKMPPVSLAHFTPTPDLLDLLPKEMMAKRLIV